MSTSKGSRKPTLGVLYGNRDFFPDALVTEARTDISKVLSELKIDAVQLSDTDSKLGGLSTHADARKCADLFNAHRDRIDGILVVLPNFGDEKAVADTLKLAKLKRGCVDWQRTSVLKVERAKPLFLSTPTSSAGLRRWPAMLPSTTPSSYRSR